MRARAFLFILLFFSGLSVYSQFPPPAGQEGSTAISMDSLIFTNWASGCVVSRGLMDISNPGAGYVSAGESAFATGSPDIQIVSLGDGGTAVLTFENPLVNDAGPDFAVFENGFTDEFLELAFVEVSSNGLDYFRFPSVSLTETSVQINAFGLLDARKLHNLGGKYRAGYGTPFDLDDLPDNPVLNKNHITYIRITDVTGSIDDSYASFDSQGNRINDPWPTAFESGGFDLDAVGVIHELPQSVKDQNNSASFLILHNPAWDILYISSVNTWNQARVVLIDQSGREVLSEEITIPGEARYELSLRNLEKGVYIGRIFTDTEPHSFKIVCH